MGAAQKNINQQIVRNFSLLVPDKKIMRIFFESLFPMFQQQLILQSQNQKLKAARDLLLPRLMNGEITV